MSLYHLYFCSKLSSNLKVLKTFHFMMYDGEKFNAFNFELNLLYKYKWHKDIQYLISNLCEWTVKFLKDRGVAISGACHALFS